MAYDYTKWQRWSSGYDLSNNAMWNYSDTATAIATMTAANFFDANKGQLAIGDLIWLVASDALDGEFASVTAVSPHVTTSVFDAVLGVGAVGTNNLAALAVTAAKIANNTITDTQVSTNGLTSASLDKTTIQYLKVPMTAAQWNGMYAAPFEIIPAPGAGKAIIVRGIAAAMTFVAAQYAAGGAVILQYDSTVTHGAGLNTCGTTTQAAATVNGFAASTTFGMGGQVPIAGIASASFVNKNVALSNATGAFTTGDGTWNIHVWYEVVTL